MQCDLPGQIRLASASKPVRLGLRAQRGDERVLRALDVLHDWLHQRTPNGHPRKRSIVSGGSEIDHDFLSILLLISTALRRECRIRANQHASLDQIAKVALMRPGLQSAVLRCARVHCWAQLQRAQQLDR